MRPELRQVIEGLGFVPKRLPRSGVFPARVMLQRDGAVILAGWPVEPDSAVTAAAALLGIRLRELEQVREKTTENGEALSLHQDGVNVVVDIQVEWTRGGRRIVRTPAYAQPVSRETR